MLRVGLTGGIGAGKSTVARRLAALGAVLIDADRIARDVVAPDTPGFKAVVAEFGPSVVADDGSLDRPALGRVVFADEARRRALNSIVHPLVAERRAELMASAPADAVVVEDIPLLVENDLGAGFHLVLVVEAPAQERVRRLVADRGMSENDAWARIRSQADDDARRAAADVLLDNTGTPDDVSAAVDRAWRDRIVPFEANVRSRTVVRQPEAPEVVSYDPRWAEQARRLSARVAYAAGDHATAVDHVGSTSVPGLLARDVIDLQLSVRSLDDAEAARSALEDAGFPLVGTVPDTPKHHQDPGLRRKRLHGSADPGRIVHLHVREEGSPGWRSALLFRDWLRAERVEADAYAAEKLQLASAHATTSAYAEAKAPWFEDAQVRAEAWAARSGWSPAH